MQFSQSGSDRKNSFVEAMAGEPEFPQDFQRMEEEYYGASAYPDSECESADSGGVNQRLAESYVPDDSPSSEVQVMIQTKDDTSVRVHASTQTQDDAGVRASALRRSRVVYGSASSGFYRLAADQGVALYRTMRGRCLHFANCRHLHDKETGRMWQSNIRLERCTCLEKVYSGKKYPITNEHKVHVDNPCSHWEGVLIGTPSACAVCTRGL